jgi:hypothetical protein
MHCIATQLGRDASYLATHKEELLQPWRNVVLGRAHRVSEANDDAWRTSLLHICNLVQDAARKKIAELDRVETRHEDWMPYAMECVRKLWAEEEAVAECVGNSVQSNVEF